MNNTREAVAKFLTEHPNSKPAEIFEGVPQFPKTTLASVLKRAAADGSFVRAENGLYSLAAPLTVKMEKPIRRPAGKSRTPSGQVQGVVERYLQEHGPSLISEIVDGIASPRGSVQNVISRGMTLRTIRKMGKVRPHHYALVDAPRQQSALPQQFNGASRGPSELDAAIAALEVRVDALQDTIRLLKGMQSK